MATFSCNLEDAKQTVGAFSMRPLVADHARHDLAIRSSRRTNLRTCRPSFNLSFNAYRPRCDIVQEDLCLLNTLNRIVDGRGCEYPSRAVDSCEDEGNTEGRLCADRHRDLSTISRQERGTIEYGTSDEIQPGKNPNAWCSICDPRVLTGCPIDGNTERSTSLQMIPEDWRSICL